MPFAQLVIGPPGSGKSTYCDGMHQFMSAIGRPSSVVNLDPANDRTSYKPALDVHDLVSLDEIMASEELGPNGGVLYALEELEHNIQWLEDGLKKLGGLCTGAPLCPIWRLIMHINADDYVLFDCPGQVELFTHHYSLRNIFFRLEKLGYRVRSPISPDLPPFGCICSLICLLQLVTIHLTDSFVLTQPSLYISALLLVLRTMLQMDLPQVNVLTKIDNLSNFPPLLFNLDFYTEVHDLEYLLPHLDAERSGVPLPSNDAYDREPDAEQGVTAEERPKSKFAALNRAIIELVQDFSLVSFETLAVEDKASMANLLRVIDRASGYAFGQNDGANDTVWQIAMREGYKTMDIKDVQERWVERKEEFDEAEQKAWAEEGRQWREEPGDTGGWNEMEGVESAGGSGDLPPIKRGMMGRDVGIKIVRKQPPDAKS